MVEEKFFILDYCKIDDQLTDIFTKPLSKMKFIKFHTLFGLQKGTIMGGCIDVILPPKFPKYCINGGCWNQRLCWFITYLDLLKIINRLIDQKSS